MGKGTTIAVVAAVVVACISGVQAEVVIDTVSVGNPGNAGELSGAGAGGWGPDRICGAVDYVYRIGTFEVTAGQYTEFLNAVAATDTYGLYNTAMLSSNRGCKIRQTGSPGGYAYLVDADGDDLEDPDWVDRPVDYVSWGDAARFSNWLHNGQPTGAQDLSTTEDGSYFLDGALSDAELSAVTREPDASWVIPSEDEWYKAAFHYNDGVTGNYWDYPTSSDSVPSGDLIDPDPGNNATFYDDGWTIGPPYYRTEFGAHENSDSPYGTFDQGGNVREWNEIVLLPSWRGLRGGSFNHYDVSYLHAARRFGWHPTYENYSLGFRVANVALELAVPLDIKPGSCPNPFNRHGHGVLPVALVGTAEFDPTEVDLSTLQLSRADGVGGSVAPNEGPPGPHSMVKDAARLFDGEPCDCQNHGPDGVDDLSMKFRTDELVEALELDALPGGSVVELVLAGSLLDGTAFVANDCIVILPPGDTSPANAHVESTLADTFVEVAPLDLNFDDDGFADFSRSYYGGTVMTLTAPAHSAGRRFVRWLVDTVPQPIGMRSIEVMVSKDTTLKAIYARPRHPNPDGRTEPDGPLE